jgi:branched-chain amino acid transport system permease protein
MFAPLAIYKTFASGALLVTSFLHLPQGIFGALIQIMTRLGGAASREAGTAGNAAKTGTKTEVPAS